MSPPRLLPEGSCHLEKSLECTHLRGFLDNGLRAGGANEKKKKLPDPRNRYTEDYLLLFIIRKMMRIDSILGAITRDFLLFCHPGALFFWKVKKFPLFRVFCILENFIIFEVTIFFFFEKTNQRCIVRKFRVEPM